MNFKGTEDEQQWYVHYCMLDVGLKCLWWNRDDETVPGLQNCWRRDNKICENLVLGYTYYSISDGYCNNVKPVKLMSSKYSNCFMTEYGKVFGKKLRKLNNCPLIVSLLTQTPYMKIVNGSPSGADGNLLPTQLMD